MRRVAKPARRAEARSSPTAGEERAGGGAINPSGDRLQLAISDGLGLTVLPGLGGHGPVDLEVLLLDCFTDLGQRHLEELLPGVDAVDLVLGKLSMQLTLQGRGVF